MILCCIDANKLVLMDGLIDWQTVTPSIAIMMLLAEWIRGSVMYAHVGVIRHFPVLQIPVTRTQYVYAIHVYDTGTHM